MAPENNNEFNNTTMANENKLSGWIVKVGETMASYTIGQYVLKKVDRVLWISEKIAQWSVPYDKLEQTTTENEKKDDDNKENKELVLVRPLPWLLFFPALIFFRMFRIVLNVCALLVGLETVSALKIVKFIQNRRRSLRAIRYAGLSNIRQKEQARSQSFFKWVYSKISLMICIPQAHLEENGPGKSCLETVIVNNNDDSDQDTDADKFEEANKTVESLIDKINKLANMSSEEDSNFEPTDEEDENSETISSASEYEDEQTLEVIEETHCKSNEDEDKINELATPEHTTNTQIGISDSKSVTNGEGIEIKKLPENSENVTKSNENDIENGIDTKESGKKNISENGTENNENGSTVSTVSTEVKSNNLNDKSDNLTNNITNDISKNNAQEINEDDEKKHIISTNSVDDMELSENLENQLLNENNLQQLVEQEINVEENEIDDSSYKEKSNIPIIKINTVSDTDTNNIENTEMYTNSTSNEHEKTISEQLIESEQKNEINVDKMNNSQSNEKQTSELFLHSEQQCNNSAYLANNVKSQNEKSEVINQEDSTKDIDAAEDSSKESKGTVSTDDYFTPKSSSSSSPDRHATNIIVSNDKNNEKSSENMQNML